MAVDRSPILKKCRTLGVEPQYLGIDKKSNRNKNNGNKKLSEYGLQLREKQKAKFIYGVLEKPFRNYFAKAERMKGQTGENLMITLERRLEVVGHRHVLVNGKVVNIPSFLVSAGDKIEIKEKAKETKRYKEITEETGSRIAPSWLDANLEQMKVTIKNLPTREEIDVPVDELMIVELYSK